MRSLIFLPAFGFALLVLGAGVAVVVSVTAAERRMDAHMRSIRAGQVRPETLTVVRKYLKRGRYGYGPHVVFGTPGKREVDELVRQSFYDAAKTGDLVNGYPSPDGYVIPKATPLSSKGVDVFKWFFLAPGLLAVLFVIALALLQAAGYIRVRGKGN